MAHNLKALIVHKGAGVELIGRIPKSMRKTLPQDFIMLPLTDDLEYILQQEFSRSASPHHERAERLLPGVTNFAAQLSEYAPVAYIETEYFGGFGSQTALVWKKGRIVCGPIREETPSTPGGTPSDARLPAPINRTLRYLGVKSKGCIDEFEGLGLNHWRLTEDD